MNIKNKFLLGILGVSALFSCETTELEGLLDNPNGLAPSQINIASGIDGLQFQMNNVFRGTSAIGADATRLSWMFGTTYQNAFGPGTGEGAWNAAYAGILLDSNVILENVVTFDAAYEEGIIRTIRGYALMTLVDYWGDVPYTEALQGVGNFNPAVDSGQTVYQAALAELEAGAVALDRYIDPTETVGAVPGGDLPINLFFPGTAAVGTPPADEAEQLSLATAWLKVNSTLQFKYHLNVGNTAALNTLIASGNLIDDNSENMTFQYSTATAPASRNPVYAAEYGDDTPGDYISNSLMYRMVDPDNLYFGEDPRAAFYFYRQETEFPTPTTNPSIGDALPCFDDPSPYAPSIVFCAFDLTDGNPAAFWGRDHGDAGGIPPDNNLRTTYGVYPIGGNVDTGAGGGVSDGDGLDGAGITPILMSWQVDLMRAEAQMTLGTVDSPAADLLESGIQKSVSYVTGFDTSATNDDNGVGYSTNVVTQFNAAANMDERMQILGLQFWMSCFQSGNEMYNFYRRTGYPNNLQPHLQLGGAGPFPRSLFYVTGTANLNSSVQQKSDLTQSVFWADASIPLN